LKNANKWGLEINLDKSHYMFIGQQKSDLLLEGCKLIKQCIEYRYIGRNINSEGTHDSEKYEIIKLGRYFISTLDSVLSEKNVKKRKDNEFIIQ
jgi:hypothetical protein